MPSTIMTCGQCNRTLPVERVNATDFWPCPGCGFPQQISVFPNLLRLNSPDPKSQPVVIEGETSCFYHPKKKAVVPCDSCGRFLCALCEVEFEGRHLCLSCLEAGQRKGDTNVFGREYLRYDRIAFVLALISVPMSFFSIFIFPVVLFLTVRHWKTPLGVFRRRQWLFLVAVLGSGISAAFWTLFIALTLLDYP